MDGQLVFWTAFMAVGAMLSALIAIPALALSIINYRESHDPRVRWTVEKSSGPSTEYQWRIVNSSKRWSAHVTSVIDPDYLEDPGIQLKIALPADIEPGNWVTVQADHYLSRHRNKARITWRQQKHGSQKLGRKVLTSELFL